MQSKLVQIAASAMGRPLLMNDAQIGFWADRIRNAEPRIFAHKGRFAALRRRLAGMVDRTLPVVSDDDGIEFDDLPIGQKLAYAPRYIGEPEDAGFCWTLKDGVALLCVDTPLLDEGWSGWFGAFHGYDTLLTAMREASADPRVKGIFLKMDSPGGFATGGIVTLAKWMRENRAAAGGKPIWVYAKMACSGAMWIAAQSDRIVCPEMAYVGSIGAYSIHCDASGFYEKEGFSIQEFAMWENKTDGADWKPMSESGAADAMADIGQIVNLFAADMTAGRPQLTFDALKNMRSRAFFSRHDDPERSGLALGLCDEISDEEATFHALVYMVSVPAGTQSATAKRAGSAANASAKEKPMAVKTGLAARKAAHKVEDPKKDECADPANPEDEGGDNSDTEPMPEDENGDPPPPPPEDGEEDTGEDGEKKPENEASAIAASAEAKAEPQMALAAISSGMSLAQFQAQVAALPNRSRGGNALAQAMAGAQRLRPDAAKPGGSSFGDLLIADAKKRGTAQR